MRRMNHTPHPGSILIDQATVDRLATGQMSLHDLLEVVEIVIALEPELQPAMAQIVLEQALKEHRMRRKPH